MEGTSFLPRRGNFISGFAPSFSGAQESRRLGVVCGGAIKRRVFVIMARDSSQGCQDKCIQTR